MKLLFLFALPVVAADYQAGLGIIDITPPIGHEMGGYSARTHGATGTHDPLYATVLVIEDANNSVALVTCDLRSFVSTRVAAEAKRRYGIQTTLINVSHTHSGPLTWELRSPWYAQAEDKMIEAIGIAKDQMFPATLQISTGEIYLGHNRRQVIDGKGVMRWRNAEALPSHPVDSTVTTLIVKDQTRVRAVLVNYACHPSVLGPDNYEYSADYPGAMRRAIEAQMPGATALFIQGGAGDINPYRDKEPVTTQFQAMEEMGSALGKFVISTMKTTHPVTGALRTYSEVRNSIGWAAGSFGNSFCFASLPGEPFVEFQLTFREKTECTNSMLFGYTYSGGGVWAGYIPTILAAVEGGYGADYNRTVPVGTGEEFIDRAVVKLFELRGLLKEVPR